jgi:G3E family GTPase
MADPRSMRRLLSECGLDALFYVAGVTAVVDPGTLMKLLLVLPNNRGQIESADLILLNKSISIRRRRSPRCERKSVRSNRMRRSSAVCGGAWTPRFILADGVSARAAAVDAAFGLCKDPHYEREAFVFSAPLDLRELRRAFETSAEGLYRAKGNVLTTEGWMHLDWSAGMLDVGEGDPSRASALVAIGTHPAVWAQSRRCAILYDRRDKMVGCANEGKKQNDSTAVRCAGCGDCAGAGHHRGGNRKPRYNVVLIVCDDLNDYVTGVVGVQRSSAGPYAAVEKLAASGVAFRRAYSNNPICAPSRSSFLTGVYPHTSGNFGFAIGMKIRR